MGLATAKYVVLKSFLGAEEPANKVLVVSPDTFSSRGICHREDGLILYLPNSNLSNKKEKSFFEIVIHRPTEVSTPQSFSLYRSASRDEAELKFFTLKDKLPVFLEIVEDMCNVNGMQKLTDTLFEHPQWTLAHLAAHFALHDCLNNPKVSNYLNSTDEESGMSPLQVAIVTKNLRTVQILVDAKCSLEHLDNMNNTVYHYAANSTKEIISALTQGTPPACLDSSNKEGYTALHKACLADKRDCVKALLSAGADVNKTATTTDEDIKPSNVSNFVQTSATNSLYDEDMKNGGTPLHWACSKPVIETLIDMNCHINLTNFQKRTALHVMALRKRLDCAVALLSRNANPDLGDEDGNRPIHLAAKSGCIPIIQSLIIFGADINLINNRGETARHLIDPKLLYYLSAVGAKRCPDDMMNCKDGCRFNGTYEGIPPPPVTHPTNRDQLNQMLMVATMEILTEKFKNNKIPQKGHLLCLDGGGIRGLILVQCLLEIENVLQTPLVNHFDWIAGTSTGGILALALATGKSMKDCLCLYFRLKEHTFIGNRPYPSEALESVLKETFGCDTVMTDVKEPKLIITGTLADRKPAELHLFRNYESAHVILGIKHDSPYELPPPPEEQFIWEVGRATGAAPTYFRSFGRYLDGGLIANNPTLDAMTEIQENNLALKAVGREDESSPLSLVLSIGTGHIPVTEVKNVDVYRPEKLLDNAKLMFGLSALGNLLIDQATSSDGRVVDRARSWCASIGVPYFRFCPIMSEEFALNEKDDEKLCKMLWETKVYMLNNIGSIKELVDILN